jgi:hypothetical protein
MTALVDSSSAIILYKAHLHLVVCRMYNVVLSTSVYAEITGNSYPGAQAYQQLLADKKITLQTPLSSQLAKPTLSSLQSLDEGERDIIELYYAGKGDFVVTDDGAAAKYCKREQIRFINALLIPAIMRYSGQQSDVYCQTAFNKVLNIGRYSQWVINFAEKCKREELSFFFHEKNADD